jgi:hypothetical protein
LFIYFCHKTLKEYSHCLLILKPAFCYVSQAGFEFISSVSASLLLELLGGTSTPTLFFSLFYLLIYFCLFFLWCDISKDMCLGSNLVYS